MLKAYGTNEPIGALPRVLQVALPLLGVQEIAGTKSNKTIIAWRDEINQAVGVNPLATAVTGYSNDDIPWCGLFEGYVNLKAGKQMVEGPLWARNWAKFGVPVAVRSKGVLRFEPGMEACLGDTVVLQREGGGGHVFKYICENKTHIWGIGGNQGNKVSIAPFKKSLIIAIRRPHMRVAPASVRPVIVSLKAGKAVSQA